MNFKYLLALLFLIQIFGCKKDCDVALSQSELQKQISGSWTVTQKTTKMNADTIYSFSENESTIKFFDDGTGHRADNPLPSSSGALFNWILQNSPDKIAIKTSSQSFILQGSDYFPTLFFDIKESSSSAQKWTADFKTSVLIDSSFKQLDVSVVWDLVK